MYTILKPEARKHIATIERTLLEKGFEVASRHSIADWSAIAPQIYSPQIKEDAQFAGEFNSYLWLTSHFFGNNATALILSSEGRLEDNLYLLSEFKAEVRKRINGNDGKIKVFLNLDKIDPQRNHNIGYVGKLGVQVGNTLENGEDGRWDDFYFKYVHVPDPQVSSYHREIFVLERAGIFDRQIPKESWLLMKEMQTLTYPEGAGHE